MLFIRHALFIFTILFSSTINVYAYLDPGTFSIILNSIIALFAGVGVYVTLFWFKIKMIFTKKKKITPEDKK